jgi:glyoxylase I family protein
LATQLELFSFPQPPARVNNPEACGLRHLAFRVNDLDQAIAALTQHEVPCEPVRLDEQTGRRFTFFKDPDGLPLEFYEEPPNSGLVSHGADESVADASSNVG